MSRALAAECQLQPTAFWVSRHGCPPLADWTSARVQHVSADQQLRICPRLRGGMNNAPEVPVLVPPGDVIV
eukprot:6530917-Prorocentrum_lima.AAC.1